MNQELASVEMLVDEYQSLVAETTRNDRAPAEISLDDLTVKLVSSGDWSPQAARTIVFLATEYGAFILRNALALSLALKIEDGELGF